MSGDIEDFLRRVMEQRQRQGKPARPQQSLKRPEPPEEPVLDAETLEVVEEVEVVREGVAGLPHPQAGTRGTVARHLDSSRLADHAAHLGEQVAMADDTLEARLHKTFDHELGSLGHLDEEQAQTQPSAASVAQSIREMLSSPKSARQAIIISEILRPPFEY